MHLKRIISMATVLASAMLSSGIAQGSVGSTLTLTENSSTSLSASLSSGLSQPETVTVNFSGTPDLWTLTFSGPVTGIADWTEPGGTSVNTIQLTPGAADSLTVRSDVGGLGPVPITILGNGETSDAFTLDGALMNVTFNDNGDSASVPDATSTFPLLSLSLAGLAFLAKHKKALQF